MAFDSTKTISMTRPICATLIGIVALSALVVAVAWGLNNLRTAGMVFHAVCLGAVAAALVAAYALASAYSMVRHRSQVRL